MKNKIFKFFILITLILVSNSFFKTNKAYGLATCDGLDSPGIVILINGSSYSADASINVSPGTPVPFTVYTFAEPMSTNKTSYPSRSYIYYQPSSSGRSYTTDAINSTGQIIAWAQQHCDTNYGVAQENQLTITLVPTSAPAVCQNPDANNYGSSLPCTFDPCSISSFTADNTNPSYDTSTVLRFTLNNSFPWDITLLAGTSLPNPDTGTSSSGTANTGNLTHSQTYRLSCGANTRDVTITVPSQTCDNTAASNYGGSLPCLFDVGVITGVNVPKCSAGTYTASISYSGTAGWMQMSPNLSFSPFSLKSQPSNPQSYPFGWPGEFSLNPNTDYWVRIQLGGTNSAALQFNVPVNCPRNCAGSWGSCSGGSQTYTITTTAAYGGTACPYINGATQACGVPGVCGSSSGSSFYSAPASNLCSVGNASSVSGSGPWNWNCISTNGGVSSGTCSASKIYDCVGAWGSCSNGAQTYNISTAASNGGVFCPYLNGAVQSCGTPGVCSSTHYNCSSSGGSTNNTSGATTWTWTCLGSGGGAPTSCSENKIMSGTLTPTSSSCTISSGASSCSQTLTWTTTNPIATSTVTNNGNATPSSPSGNNTYQLFNIPYNSGAVSFYLYNNNTPIATSTVTTNCTAGTAWDSRACSSVVSGSCGPGSSPPYTHYSCYQGTAFSPSNGASEWTWGCAGINGGTSTSATACTESKPVMSGTLVASPPTCVISAGASSCNVDLIWTTTNPEGTSAVTAIGIADVNGNSGSQSFSVPHGGRTFYLYNNAKSLVPTSLSPLGSGITVIPSCFSDTTWNGTICAESTIMSGSLTPTSPSCVITKGNSSCDVELTWSVTNHESVDSAITAISMGNRNYSNVYSGVDTFPVPHGTRTFYLYNNAKSLVPIIPNGAGIQATSGCSADTNWDPDSGVCVIAITQSTACSKDKPPLLPPSNMKKPKFVEN